MTIAKNVIDTFEKLQAAVNAGGTVQLGGNITLGDEEKLAVRSSVPVILDLNGYTLTSNNLTPITVGPNNNCTIKNGTVTNTADKQQSAVTKPCAYIGEQYKCKKRGKYIEYKGKF